jgi:hypothetical protein
VRRHRPEKKIAVSTASTSATTPPADDSSEPYAIISALLRRWFHQQMEDPMCWEIDYKFFAEQKKAQEARTKQEQRTGVIDRLLNEAHQQGDTPHVEAPQVKEVAPAK